MIGSGFNQAHQDRVQSHYKTPHYNTNLDITYMDMLWLLKYFYHGILQNDYRKMTMKWSFSYNPFVTLSLYNTVHL